MLIPVNCQVVIESFKGTCISFVVVRLKCIKKSSVHFRDKRILRF